MMQVISKAAVIPAPTPNTFAGLMELYESNYIKIKKLCINFNKLHDECISQVTSAMDLHLTVLERTPYTITLKLTYRFSHNSRREPRHYPNTVVRVYVDAMQAEVLQRTTGKCADQEQSTCHLFNKWRDNRFLFKWLSFCLHQGHAFVPEPERSKEYNK